jgi:hypothetical protein
MQAGRQAGRQAGVFAHSSLGLLCVNATWRCTTAANSLPSSSSVVPVVAAAVTPGAPASSSATSA